MANPWLSVLKNVPWSEVIGNAPMVADGAKKLWGSIAGKPAPAQPGVEEVHAAPSSEPFTALDARMSRLEGSAAELHRQMLTSSELIATLADQNAQLVKHIEENRVRLRTLTIANAVIGVVAVAALVVAIVR